MSKKKKQLKSMNASGYHKSNLNLLTQIRGVEKRIVFNNITKYFSINNIID